MRRLLILLALALPLLAGDPDLSQPLPVDPNVTKMGKLENGMRYWIRPNRTPPGKVSLMLHIHSGSLNEAENQRGLAHFLEHMAFNGSENFSPGKMVRFFESLGMRFGQHQNAFTSFDQTTYMMHLPDTKKETIEKVMLYFADVGWRLWLHPKEIDKERGVIHEEARSRKGSGQRIMEQALPLLLPGSRLSQRIPIGLPEVIAKAPRERFVEYYETWYRPGNATLLVCGDIEADMVEPLIKAAFSGWKPAAKPATQADAGIKFETGMRAALITDPELTQAQIGLGSLHAKRTLKTVGDYRAALVRRIGGWIVNRRLRRMVQKGDAPFQSATVRSGNFMNACVTSDIDASGDPAKWKEMLTAVITQVKRAQVHGFPEPDIADAKKAILSAGEQAARAEATRNSGRIIMGLNNSVTNGRTPMSSTQTAAMDKRLLPTIKADDVLASFRKTYPLDRGIVMATMPKKEGVVVPSEADLLAAAKAAAAADVAKGAEAKRATKLLDKDPEPAGIKARSEDKDLGIVSVEFDNGSVVRCRTMDFKKDSVLVTLRFAGGTIDETAETANLTGVGALALRPGMAASKRHSSTAISDLLTGKKFRYGGNAGRAGVAFQLSGSPEDMEEGFRLLHVLLSEPLLEEAAIKRWRQQMSMMLPRFKTNTGFQGNQEMVRLLSGGDPRLAIPTEERIAAIKREDAQKWLERVLKTAPIEAAIVGDMPAEDMIELARRYIGTLAKRPAERADLTELRRVKINAGPFVSNLAVDTITPRADVFLGWRGPAFGDRKNMRVLSFAAQVLSMRVNDEIREKRGLTYSSQCAIARAAFDGMARMVIVFTADPAKAAEAAKIAKQVVLDLIEKTPPTDAEMESVKKQIQNSLDTQLKQPTFWVSMLSNLKFGGRSLAELKTIEQNYAAITKEMVLETLKRYVKEDRYCQVVAAPAPKK